MTVPSRPATSPAPSVQNSVWPTACECQLVWAPGVNRTMLAISLDGPAAFLIELTYTSPVKVFSGAIAVALGMVSSTVNSFDSGERSHSGLRTVTG